MSDPLYFSRPSRPGEDGAFMVCDATGATFEWCVSQAEVDARLAELNACRKCDNGVERDCGRCRICVDDAFGVCGGGPCDCAADAWVRAHSDVAGGTVSARLAEALDGLVILGFALGAYLGVCLLASCCAQFCGPDGVCW